MRVLIVNKYARTVGGADKHSVLLANALQRRGHDVSFLATNSGTLEWSDGRFVPCTVSAETRDDAGWVSGVPIAAQALWNRHAAAAMNRLIDEFSPDVVHAHKLYPQLSVAPIAVAARRGIPVVQTAHDYEGVAASAYDATGRWRDTDEQQRRYRILNTATFAVRRYARSRFVDRWVGVSRFLADVYARHDIKMTVLPNFLDGLDGVPPMPFADREGIAYVGSLSAAKGAADVITVAESAPGTQVTIAGDGDLRNVVAAAASRLPNLTWLGRVPAEEVRALLARSRVAIVPSHCDDAGPMVAVEAMSVGTPIVAYARGGLAEYVTDAGAGLLARDVTDLAVRATALAEDRSAWSRNSESGWTAARDRHSVDRYLTRLEDVYEQAAQR